MRHALLLSSPLIAVLVASNAYAVDWYVSPTGTATTGCTTRANPCGLGSAAATAMAGDNVILMDGVYTTGIAVTNSGTASAWITFKADECSTPILEGKGVGPNDETQDTGVWSEKGEYLRFEGIVARGWNIGFGNTWAGGVDSTAKSNGHWEIKHCASYSNGRTGFTFFSAEGYKLINSISAHNGSNTKQSWSSGVSLFEAEGNENLVQGVVSFENTDRQGRSDGSGFIVDEESNNATFINNVAFGNAGSCIRMTRSSGTKFINNTCHHNSQFGSEAMGPDNPGEIYFTNGGVTFQGITFKNNVIVGTGVGRAGMTPVPNKPSSGWTNNVETTGNVAFFTDATGTNPNFTPTAGATTLVGKGSGGDGAPTDDIGFDPKCIVKRAPIMVGSVAKETWWQYDVDIDYIKSIGGVAKCYSPGTRSGTPDIGAYKVGAVTTAMPGACPLPPVGSPAGGAGAGGAAPVGGAAGAGGANPAGGAPSTAGAAGGPPGTAGALSFGGGPTGAGGAGAGTGPVGTAGAGTGIPSTSGAPSGVPGAAGSPSGVAGSLGVAGGANPPAPPPGGGDEAGCGCRVAPTPNPLRSLAALGALGLGVLGLKRRRRSR